MKNNKYRFICPIVSVFCCVLLIALFYVYNETHYIDRIKLKLGLIDYIENNSDYYALEGWKNSLESLDEDVDVVFFGDSMTRRGKWSEYFPDTKICNIGYSGDIIHGLINRVPMVEAVKPEKVFITCGINNMMKKGYESTIEDGYEELLDKLINDNKYQVYIQSILPVRSPNNINNEDIIEENKKIEYIANKYGATYIDLYSLFTDDKGYLKEELSLDGTHVNDKGYRIWKEAIREYVEN